MTTSELVDQISHALLRDDRILSDRERELLTDLTRRTNATNDPVVAEKMTRAIGETVAQRAFTLLGASITRQLLQSRPEDRAADSKPSTIYGKQPQPPGPVPPGNMPTRQPQPPSPGPPSPNVKTSRSPDPTPVALLDAPEFLPATCVVMEEFLAPAELEALLKNTLDREAEFRVSEVISPGVEGSATDFDYRRSRVLMDLSAPATALVERVRSCLPRVLPRLEREPFSITNVETQITASNDGDFFRWHTDNGSEKVAAREITFVYFFHREPKQFCGGELRIYDSRREGDGYVPTQNYRTIVPRQNQLVIFPSSLAHEITPVECLSRAFADSRFTVNGWFHR